MAGLAKKKVFFFFASALLLLRCRAENELARLLGQSTGADSRDYSIFSNLTVYLSFLDDTYNHLSSSSEVSEKCRLDSRDILERARSGEASSLKFFDAAGKPSSGILEGGVFFIGFYSECINTVVNTDNKNSSPSIQGQYCLVSLKFQDFVHNKGIPQASWLVLGQSQKPPTVGVCIPSSCSGTDLNISVLSSLEQSFENVKVNNINCHRNVSGFSSDAGALCILCVLIIFISISIAATVADIIQEKNKLLAASNAALDNAKSVSREMLCEATETKGPRKSMECLLAFSLTRNIKKIVHIGSGKEGIQGLHGLRFLTMALIIMGHTYSFGSQNLFIRNPGAATQTPKDFLSQLFANGTLAVDTFYVISGLLVAYVTLNILDKTKGKLSIPFFYVHRYCRLTPLMMMVTLISAYLLRYVGNGPNWLSSIVMFDEWCRENSWLNALYLHNFINTERMCMSHTWYLATDMQFYLIVPLILIPLYRSAKLGYLISFLFLLATTITTGVITKVNHYPAIPYLSNIMNQTIIDAYYRDVYIKPYCRLGPYVIGILFGHFLWLKKEFILTKIQVALAWMTSTAVGLTVIYLMWPANRGILPTDDEAAAYSSLARTVWSLCLVWLLFACNYGYAGFINSILSWSPLIPFSRLTYCAYLIHPVVMNAFYGTIQFTVDFSLLFMIYLFIGNIVITFLLSIFLSALFEAPFIALEKVILKKSS